MNNNFTCEPSAVVLKKFVSLLTCLDVELDINSALESVRQIAIDILECERITLFLVLERERELRARIKDTEENDMIIRVAFGQGIAGTVAQTGQLLNIPDAYQCQEFNAETDKRTGFRTQSILCFAIRDVSGKNVAVLQALNKKDGGQFTTDDELHLQLVGQTLGNTIVKSKLHENAKRERNRLTTLLRWFKILTNAGDLRSLVQLSADALRELILAAEVFVFLVDKSRSELWTSWTTADVEQPHTFRLKLGEGYIGRSAQAMTPLCVTYYGESEQDPAIDALQELVGLDRVKSVLAQPLLSSSGDQCLAVLVAVNKKEGLSETDILYEDVYTQADSEAAALLAIELGENLSHRFLELAVASAMSLNSITTSARTSSSGAHPAGSVPTTPTRPREPNGLRAQLMQLYVPGLMDIGAPYAMKWLKRAKEAKMDRHKGAAGGQEVMLTASSRNGSWPQVNLCPASFSHLHEPGSLLSVDQLRSWDTDMCQLSNHDLVHLARDVFVLSGVVDHFGINQQKLLAFCTAAAAQYTDTPYHNFCHAFHVMHGAWLIVETTQLNELLSMSDKLALLVAALCHDLGHDGRTNSFHVNSFSARALQFNDASVQENHHCTLAFQTLRRADCDIMAGFDAGLKKELRKSIITAIMSTDMVHHFQQVQDIKNHSLKFSADSEADRMFLLKVVLHAADISASARPFPVEKFFAQRVHQEFKAQAAEEKQLELPITMNVGNSSSWELQVHFLDCILIPLWERLAEAFPGLQPCMARIMENRAVWLSAKDNDIHGVDVTDAPAA